MINNSNNTMSFLKEKLNLFSKKLAEDRTLDENFVRKDEEVNQTYTNMSSDFVGEYVNRTEYIQYAKTYFNRLVEVKPKLIQMAKDKWKSFKICQNILDMKGKETQVIFGVIYKEMPLKPSILKGVETILGSKKVDSFVNEADDHLIIEDQSGRVRISNHGPFSPSEFITGIIMAAKGRFDEKGVFIMEDVLFNRVESHSLPERIRNLKVKENSGPQGSSVYQMLSSDSNIVAFISGLQFGKQDYTGKSHLARNLLMELIQGRCALEGAVNNLIKRIVRVVLVGNSVSAPEDTELVEKGSYIKQDLNARVYRTLLQNYDDFDNFLNSLSHSVEVDLMPGNDDSTSAFFPQLPVNTIMLPQSCHNNSITFASNPHKFSLDGVLFLGSGGQNIDDIRKYTTVSKNPVDILEKTLQWAHICPSAPDTLRTYPSMENDPLILREIPNVYFVGNQKAYDTRLTYDHGDPVRLISIPDFSLTFSFVLLDMNSLDTCEYILELNNN